MYLLRKGRVQHTAQKIMGVSKQKEEYGDHQGQRGRDLPHRQQTLDQTWTPHQDAGSQYKPLMMANHLPERQKSWGRFQKLTLE
jgi:hypothetical protein